ncbi:uncharacterized protein LOC121070440 isoform X5 [Cygnus olor]|uniref:uncharacterized protein LOC121070440 isoform X5 n=1 Tax=Cygnus olor TaxID=8869 RepID=UPI001ADEAF40|nr:uncharacterized protein LOC121070440 isoform X5 [Cygnus olor]
MRTGLEGPSLETQMVEDETETTSEELPPHLREEPPEGLQITGAPGTPRTGSNQPYGSDWDQGLREHEQGDEARSSTLMKTSYFIPTTNWTTTREYYASAEGLVR